MSNNQVKKLITFSLWGLDEFYNYGAYENALIAKTIYPGWICRFYYSNIDETILKLLSKLDNVELVDMKSGHNYSNMFWRFIPAFNGENAIVMSRDADSRLNMREKLAVDEWLKSDKDFIIMRDHVHHKTRILGGMWCSRNSLLKPLKKQFDNYSRIDKVGNDQKFLQDIVYNHVINKSIIYDTMNFYKDEKNVFKFTESEYKGYIGSYCRKATRTFKALGQTDRLLRIPERLKNRRENLFCDF